MSPNLDAERLLDLYCGLAQTAARRPSPADRRLAAELCRQGLAFDLLEGALLLAVARRNCRPPQAPPLPPIRSLAYFLPVLEELRQAPPHPDYLQYLRSRAADPKVHFATDSRER